LHRGISRVAELSLAKSRSRADLPRPLERENSGDFVDFADLPTVLFGALDRLLFSEFNFSPKYQAFLKHLQIGFVHKDSILFFLKYCDMPCESIRHNASERIVLSSLNSQIFLDYPESPFGFYV
jgi:hypothetical protein